MKPLSVVLLAGIASLSPRERAAGTIELQPSYAAPGETVRVLLRSWPPDAASGAKLMFAAPRLQVLHADADLRFTVPDLPDGPTEIRVETRYGGASATLSVVRKPVLRIVSVTPKNARRRESISIRYESSVELADLPHVVINGVETETRPVGRVRNQVSALIDSRVPFSSPATVELAIGSLRAVSSEIAIVPSAPEIHGIEPANALPGESVVVRFAEDVGDSARDVRVVIGGQPAKAFDAGRTFVRVEVPDVSPGTVPVSVELGGTFTQGKMEVRKRPVPWAWFAAGASLLALLTSLGLWWLVERSRRERKRAAETADEARLRRERIAARKLEPAADQGPAVPAVPEELVKALSTGECLLFAGRGLGVLAGYPGFSALVIKLADFAGTDDNYRNDLELALQQGDSASAAESIRARISDEALRARISEAYASSGGPSSSPKEPMRALPEAHRLLSVLPFGGILSGSWDPAAEEAFPSPAYERLSVSMPESFGRTQRLRTRFLMRVYGGPAKGEPLYFSADDYQRALYENESYKRFLSTVISTSSVLFIGESIEGIERFVAPLVTRDPPARHFALVPWRAGMEAVAERFRLRFGIRLLPFHPTSGYPEVTTFLSALHNQLHNALQGTASVEPVTRSAPGLDHVALRDIGPFAELDLDLRRGWNVLLGNNGSGKSSILRAIALGLCGEDAAAREAGASLLRAGCASGSIELRSGSEIYRTELFRAGQEVIIKSRLDTPLQQKRWVVLGFPPLRGISSQQARGPTKDGSRDPEIRDVLPVIGGAVDLRMDGIKQWLVNTYVRAKEEQGGRYAKLLAAFFEMLTAVTPGVQCSFESVDPRTWQVMVRTEDGVVPLELVSQGTSSIFSWLGTLLQRLYEIHGDASDPRKQPALLLIDELDAHMHPDWQRRIVPALRDHFPEVQVIATTHSPLIVGSLEEVLHVYREKPGPGGVKVDVVKADFRGFRADQILTTRPFGLQTSISEDGAGVMQEYQQLLGKPVRTPEEQARFVELSRKLDEKFPGPAESEAERLAEGLLNEWLLEKVRQQRPELRERIRSEAEALWRKSRAAGVPKP